jgi:hypothetical protein
MTAMEKRGNIIICTCQLERCKHQWASRRKVDGEPEKPIVCPKCHSPYWYLIPKEKIEVKDGKEQ